MRKYIHLKMSSLILIVAMLAVTINGVHETVHALQAPVAAAGDEAAHQGVSVPHHSPCSPLEQHNDYDGCDTCANCTCHAPLTIEPLQLRYDPIIVSLGTPDIFKHLPEVYLSKFIPPQNHA